MTDKKQTKEEKFVMKCASLCEKNEIENGLFCVVNKGEWDIAHNIEGKEELLLSLIISIISLPIFPTVRHRLFSYLVSELVERAQYAPSDKTKMN